VTGDALKLTIYFGERDRAGSRFLADALCGLAEHRGFATSVMLRGIEGFGFKHHLHTGRLLTLSEDLPLVFVAVDVPEQIEATVPEVRELMGDGLISLERARFSTDPGDAAGARLGEDAVRLTLYAGRAEQVGRRPAYIAAVEALRRAGMAGASAIPAVDGTLRGERRRARFFSSNAQVPMMLLAVGSREAAAAAVEQVGDLFSAPMSTLENVRVCKRAGESLAEPAAVPERDAAGLPLWQKVTIHSELQAKVDGHPLHVAIVRALRQRGAAGATVLRGMWGFYADRPPFGDRFLSLRRQVPISTVILDTPTRMREWWVLVDELTREAGLVTSEMVPAARATGPGVATGGLELDSPGRPTG